VFPQIIIGIILVVVGARLPLSFPIANLVRLALVLIGVTILGYGIFGTFTEFSG